MSRCTEYTGETRWRETKNNKNYSGKMKPLEYVPSPVLQWIEWIFKNKIVLV